MLLIAGYTTVMMTVNIDAPIEIKTKRPVINKIPARINPGFWPVFSDNYTRGGTLLANLLN
jgi:hypothetical protein